MKKTLLSVVLVGLVATTFMGCGDEPKPAEFDNRCKQESVLAPKWTCNPHMADSYAGLGIAQKSSAGMGFMRKVALAEGRSDLAQQIQTEVKDKMETFTRATGVATGESVDQVKTAVSKQVAKVNLQGSKAVDMWTAPSGALYMLVTVSNNEVNKKVQNAVKTSFKNDDALWQQFQSQQAMEGLEKEFPIK